jgi:hypothetical protein
MRTAASLRSSFFANRLRAALWIAAVGLASSLVVAVVLGFRTHHIAKKTSRRAVVAAYIARVDRIEIAMAPQVRAIDKQYKLFAKDPQGLARRAPQYRQAERTLALLASRLAAVRPPREARKLHALLVRLANANVVVATQVAALASYLPALARAQAPLRTAILTLRAGVRKGRTAKAQARAFGEYAAATSAIAGRVATLRPPAVFRAARAAEFAQLGHLSSIAGGIETALLAKKAKTAQQLVTELGKVEAESDVVRAQRAAAKAFDGRLRLVASLGKQIEAERTRLEKALPA